MPNDIKGATVTYSPGTLLKQGEAVHITVVRLFTHRWRHVEDFRDLLVI